MSRKKMHEPMADKIKPITVKIKERQLLTKVGSSKQTYHIVLDLETHNMNFQVGDSVAIFPQNDPLLVKKLLKVIRSTGEEIVADPKSQDNLSLHDFLTYKANLSRLNRTLLRFLHEHQTDHRAKEELHHILNTDQDSLFAYLENHDPLHVLSQHSDQALPLNSLVSQFSSLLPRFYSIASSPKTLPSEIHLTVSTFIYNHAGEKRHGVASHFLCHLAEVGKTPIPIYIQRSRGFTLPKDSSTPIIMIGPGTGVAPFRAFLQERIQIGSTGKNWLFFGERNRLFDFFYEDFWLSLESQNLLSLDLAFSRDQKDKIYVQHKMYEQKKQIFAWLQEGAHLYVCGDAKRMAKDVDTTLHQIVKEEGSMTDETAKIYLKTLRSEKKYLLDVY